LPETHPRRVRPGDPVALQIRREFRGQSAGRCVVVRGGVLRQGMPRLVLAATAVSLLACVLVPGAGARPQSSTQTLVDTTNNRGAIGVSAAPGSVIAIKVVFKVGTTAWKGTQWQFLSGGTVVSSGCTNTGSNATNGTTYTEYVNVTMPAQPGAYTVQA